ncbi:hypothetical protein M8J77_025192 [Diaphorina citri]|nr:hypothetical protein M8J77_025192 [Diaphorina citri]
MSDPEFHFNIDKRRRSSILKPAKVFDNRAPLQELGASSDDTTTTSSSIYKKRVSFHVINIKEFSSLAQTQEVQKNPAYNELISSMSDSSRNNTNSECSNFSPMVPTIVVPQDEDKENQINYPEDDTDDSLEEKDTSEMYPNNVPAQYNEPFDLSTRYKNDEPRNFLESTKLSHCNTIMSTFNISGIQNLDETNLQDVDTSDGEDSFQRMMDHIDKTGTVHGYQYQRENVPIVDKENDNVSLGEKKQSIGGRKSMPRKSLPVHQEADHEDSDSIELTCHVPVNVPEALYESEMEMATTISRRKSFVPHKSVNFQQAQDDLDRSDEMEFTNAFPAMAMRANESNLDESEMEETGVFPRKSFRPVKASAVPLWQQSVPDQAKSMDLSNTYTQPQSLDDSGMEFTSAFPHKFSRKSISGNMMRNRDSESLDGSGMEMTEAFPAMPPEEYDVSMSDSMSDMDITNQYNQPPDVTNNHSMMITNQTSTANMSADFSIITSYPKSVGRKSMVVKSSEQNNFQTNETSVAFDKQGVSEYQTVPSHRVYDQHHTQHKSFSGFEQSALNLSSATLRKSAPHVMNPYYDIPTHGNADVNQSHTNTHSFKGNTSMVNFPAPMNASMGSSLVPQSSTSAPYIPTDLINPSDSSNIALGPSGQDQSLHTSQITTDLTSFQPLPMAHSTNLNMSSTITITREHTGAGVNTAISLNLKSPGVQKFSMNLSSTTPQSQRRSPVNISMDGMSMELSCATVVPTQNENSCMEMSTVVAPEVNTEDSKKEIEQEAKAQQPSESNEAYPAMPNTNMSVIQTEIVEKSLCEDISVLRNNTVQPNESADLSVQKPESRNTHPQEINNINELSNNASVLSDSALNASNASNSNSAVKQVSSVNESKCDTVDPVPCVIEPAVKPDSPARNDSQVQVSMDDGFSTHSQSIESGISPLQSVLCTSGVLDVSKMSCDLDTEKSRKRPSDGFEAHEENLVETGDAMVVANPKKRSKTFEPVDSIRETHEAEVNAGTEENPVSTSPDKTSGVAEHKSPAKAVSPGKNFEFATPGKSSVRSTPNKTAAATTTGKTSTSASSSKETFVFVTPGKTSSVRSTPNKTGTFATPNKPSGATPNKPSATPNKPSGATPNKPSATPNKPSGVVTPKGPAGTTPNKSLVIPEKLFNDTGCSQDGSFNMSTYVNPSSTLTDSAINNITDIDLPIIGSTRKPTASEVKSKQMVTCSTPLLPNSCSKNMIVDRFFESIDKRSGKPDGFVDLQTRPSKNIIKKLDMNQDIPEENAEDIVSPNRKDVSPNNEGSPSTEDIPSNTEDMAFPIDESVALSNRDVPEETTSEQTSDKPNSGESIGNLKRTKDQLNISAHNDLNSSNYIPEKQRNMSMNTSVEEHQKTISMNTSIEEQQRNISMNTSVEVQKTISMNKSIEEQQRNISMNTINEIEHRNISMNTSAQSTLDAVANDISLLDISGEFDKLDHIRTELATTLNISDAPNKSVMTSLCHSEGNQSSYTGTNVEKDAPSEGDNTDIVEQVKGTHENVEIISTLPDMDTHRKQKENTDKQISQSIENAKSQFARKPDRTDSGSESKKNSLKEINREFKDSKGDGTVPSPTQNINERKPERTSSDSKDCKLALKGNRNGGDKSRQNSRKEENSELKDIQDAPMEITQSPETNLVDRKPHSQDSSRESVRKDSEHKSSQKTVKDSMTNSEHKGSQQSPKDTQCPSFESNLKNKTSTDHKVSQQSPMDTQSPSFESNLKNKVSQDSPMDPQSPSFESNLKKKRKSRLSIVPKPGNQVDVKRRTLRIQPKPNTMSKSMAFESDDDMEEARDYEHAQRNILAEESRGDLEWKSKTLEPYQWEFEFLCGLIVLRIEFNTKKKAGKEKIVSHVGFETCERVTELRTLCFSLLHSKYSSSFLSSICTSRDDVLPLLQHISPFMSYLKQFAHSMKQCELEYCMKLNGTKATIDITNYKDLEWSQVSLDMKEIDFITSNDIRVVKMFGKLTESQIRKQFPVGSTRDNPNFMKTFIENIYSLFNTE